MNIPKQTNWEPQAPHGANRLLLRKTHKVTLCGKKTLVENIIILYIIGCLYATKMLNTLQTRITEHHYDQIIHVTMYNLVEERGGTNWDAWLYKKEKNKDKTHAQKKQ